MFVFYSQIGKVAQTGKMSRCKNKFLVYTVYQDIYDEYFRANGLKLFFVEYSGSVFDL